MDRTYFLYKLILVAFVLQQLYLWSRLIQWRRHVLYPTPVVLWSLFFIGRLYLFSFSDAIYPSILVFLFLHFLVGWLLFPRIEDLDYNSAYTYIDVYEELRQQRFWVFGIALFAEVILRYQQWVWGIELRLDSFLYLFLLLAALLTEHKGLMLVWVWLGLGVLYF